MTSERSEPAQSTHIYHETIEYVRQQMCDDYCRHPREVSARTDLTQFQKDELQDALCEECPLVNYF